VSHELNTPIGNMVLASTALTDKLAELVDNAGKNGLTRSGLLQGLQECLSASAIIARNGYRANDLIESFKRVSVDQTSQRRRRFDLRATVQDSLAALGAVIRRAKVEIELNIPDGIEMDSYPGHLEQIVNNIIMNSITHGFEGKCDGKINIHAATLEEMIVLVYSDNGCGIAPELQQKVFEPFYTTKLGQGGSGLGLSIVHNLVQAIFKGQLRLDSRPDQGVQLYFTFPAITPHTTAPAVSGDEPPASHV
jgi:signal transduction histidine kinase